MNKIKNKLKENNEIAHQHINKKLRRRLQMFAIMIIVFLIISIYKISIGDISIVLALFSSLIGLTIGAIAGRMFKIYWHSETQKVVSRLDKIGIAFLVIYIIADLGRKWFFGHWLQGAQLNAFAIIFVGGLIFGRFITLTQNIKKVLLEEGKI